MELLITEKENAARRIAEILSGASATVERRNGVNVYSWGGRRCIGLSGHVVSLDFPSEYANWRDVRPVELIDAGVVKAETRGNIVSALRSLSREADSAIIATDYDREGELIGKEAYELISEEIDGPIQRVRFSSITDREVTEAFDSPEELDFDLAAAGEARQVIDLLWGASLTRFLSLSAKRFGEDFISVGRVQSPTLRIIVEREREIDAFEPEDYWELFAQLSKDDEPFEAQYFFTEDGTENERVWDESSAESVFERLSATGNAVVESVRKRTRTDDPPHPFNTTQFIRAAGSLGITAQKAMSIAEDLYTDGYITYPRTDNTVYPEDLDERELLETFTEHPNFGEDARSLLEAEELTPTAGENETTDHPPIHPTGAFPSELDDGEWKIYELVVCRFFATLSEPATWAHLKVVCEANDCSLKANGKRLVESGYHAVYPYVSATENFVPVCEEGDRLSLFDPRLDAKQTQPPRRRGQSRLIEMMETLNIGTKSTRHNIIQKLYDRGYIEGDPPRPTTLARGVVAAAEEFADLIVSEEMTAELERDMTAIANGEATLDEVTDESREMLHRVFDSLAGSHEEIGEQLREALKADKTLGPCPVCGETLLVRRSRQGSYFVGCDGYPDCTYTLALPSKGEPVVLEEMCEEHELHHVKMLAGRDTFVHGCPQCSADEADATEDRTIGSCPDCGDEHGGELAIKHLRSGSRLVGCMRYPDCSYSLPLPRRGEIRITDENCDEHELPFLEVHDTDGETSEDDEPWELGCPICNYEEYRERHAISELSDIDGIGKKTAEKLEAAGVGSLEDLRTATPEEVAPNVQGVSEDRLREWQAQIAA